MYINNQNNNKSFPPPWVCAGGGGGGVKYFVIVWLWSTSSYHNLVSFLYIVCFCQWLYIWFSLDLINDTAIFYIWPTCLINTRCYVFRFSCHKLAYLNVNFCEHISEAGIELLGQTHSLTSLDISGCNCGDQVLTYTVSGCVTW